MMSFLSKRRNRNLCVTIENTMEKYPRGATNCSVFLWVHIVKTTWSLWRTFNYTYIQHIYSCNPQRSYPIHQYILEHITLHKWIPSQSFFENPKSKLSGVSGFHPDGRRNLIQFHLRPCSQKREVIPPKIDEFLLIDRQTTLSQKGFEGGWDRRGLGTESRFVVFTWVHVVVRNLGWYSSCCVRLIFVILFDNVVYNIVWRLLMYLLFETTIVWVEGDRMLALRILRIKGDFGFFVVFNTSCARWQSGDFVLHLFSRWLTISFLSDPTTCRWKQEWN